MKNQLFEDLIESIKELPTELLEEMRVNMNKEQIRKDFEHWAVNKRGYSVERFESEPHQYVEQNTHIAWTAWQASRESLVVELPKEPYIVDSDFTYGVSSTLNSVKESISSQGIGYK